MFPLRHHKAHSSPLVMTLVTRSPPQLIRRSLSPVVQNGVLVRSPGILGDRPR